MDADATLIAARVPELSQAELALIESALAGDVVPAATLEDILIVIGALEDRMDAFVEALDASPPPETTLGAALGIKSYSG